MNKFRLFQYGMGFLGGWLGGMNNLAIAEDFCLTTPCEEQNSEVECFSQEEVLENNHTDEDIGDNQGGNAELPLLIDDRQKWIITLITQATEFCETHGYGDPNCGLDKPLLLRLQASNLSLENVEQKLVSDRPWTSFAIFDSGRRIYHQTLDHYYGWHGCEFRDEDRSNPTNKISFFNIPEPDLVPFPANPNFKLSPVITFPSESALERESVFVQRQDPAIESYTDRIEVNPQDTSAYYNRGNRNYDLKRYESAIADYTQVIQLDPQNTVAYYNRGNAYAELKKYEAAIADYTKAIELSPESLLLPSFYNNRGLAHQQSANGFYSYPALMDFMKAIELDPEYALAYNNRGAFYYELQNYGEAIADFSQAIELAPFFVASYLNRGRAYYEDDGQRGHRHALVYSLNDGALPINQANYTKAIADYSAAINLDPKNAVAYVQQGIVQHGLKNYDQAIADYTQAITINPQYLAAYNNRGIAHSEGSKDYNRAIFDYQQAIEIDPQYAPAYYNRAVDYSLLQNDLEADFNYQKAIQLNPQYANWIIDKNSENRTYSLQNSVNIILSPAEILKPSLMTHSSE